MSIVSKWGHMDHTWRMAVFSYSEDDQLAEHSRRRRGYTKMADLDSGTILINMVVVQVQ